MYSASRLDSTSLTSRVVEQLTRAILGGQLAAQSLLPPERQLAEELGVSRNVVREATKILQSNGLVSIRQGIGTIVRGLSAEPVTQVLSRALDGQPDGLLKLIEVRLPLEVEIAGLAAERRTEADLQAMTELVDAFDASLEDLDECARLDVAFHAALARATQNPVFPLMLESFAELLLENRRQALKNSQTTVAAGHHRAILEAVAAREVQEARSGMRLHLETSRAETMAWLESSPARVNGCKG